MSMFGALAVVVGALGVYGVIASVVAQQTRELGIRVALGATTGRIVGDVLAQAGRFVAVGLVLGLPAGWVVSRSIASLLFEVRQTDVATYVIVAGVLTATALLAAWIPARRAARVDPLISLRSE
jgi:ABC-type antimicrobial peptide transport system permease subunit